MAKDKKPSEDLSAMAGEDRRAGSWGNGELLRFLSENYVSLTLGEHRIKQKNGRLRSAKCQHRFRFCTKANASQGPTRCGAYPNRILPNTNEIADRASKRSQRDRYENNGWCVEGFLFLMGFAYCHPMSALVAKSGHGHP